MEAGFSPRYLSSRDENERRMNGKQKADRISPRMGVLVGHWKYVHWKYLWKIVSRLPRKVEWMSEWRGRFIINVIRNGEEHLDEPVAYRTRRFSIYREPRMLLIPLTRRHLGGFECERHSDMKSRQVIARYRIFRVLEHNGKQSLTIFQRSRLKAREKYNACFWFLSLSLDDRFIDSPPHDWSKRLP